MKKFLRSVFALLFATTTFVQLALAQAPVANFTVDKTSGCGFVIVNFTDISTNTPTSWLWTFGDGGATSNEQNPANVYSAPGDYTVTLTATNASGSDSETKTTYIHVYEKPKVDFTASSNNACTPASISFTDNSTSTANITNYAWDFGDGNGSADANPTHVYNIALDYEVSLSITNANGCTNTKSIPNFIKVDNTPTAAFTVNSTESCSSPFTAVFSSATSVGAITEYLWDFGDGTTSTDANPSHTYVSDGDYSVSLTVSSAAGCSNTLNNIDYIHVNSFKADFTTTPTDICMGQAVVFNNTSNQPSASQTWAFGDGNSSSAAAPSKTYATSGTFDVTLTAVSAGGCSNAKTTSVTVHAKPDVQILANDSVSCTAPFSVDFTSPTPDLNAWTWDFGDGNTSINQNPSHTYITRGQYDVSLRVTDSKGCDTILTRPNYIVPLKPFPSFTTSAIACHYDSIKFVNTSTGSKLDYSWDFGDTQTFLDTTPTHKYYVTQDTIVNVILTATEQDIVGCDSVFSMPISIKRPWAKFDANETYADCPPFTPVFTENSGLPLVNWQWNFGDSLSNVNNNSVLQNPQHIYRHPGFFDVQLIVRDANNCIDTLLREDYIELGGPTGSYTFTPDVVCSPGEVTFVADTQNTVRVDWFFDDGTQARDTATNITHTYITGQTYTPAIILYDANGCPYSPDPTETLTVYEVNADFESDIEVSCMDTVIQFTDLSTASHIIDSWEWRFGDDSTSNLQNPSHDYSLGVYDVTLIVNSSICQFNSIKTDYITISEMPHPSFIVDSMVFIQEDVLFNNTSDSITSPIFYEWQIDGSLLTDTVESPVHKFDKRGNYEISLAQQTIPECVAFAFANVIVGDIVPNAFTPDNDGVNDVYLKNMGYDFIIINRWGQQMYEGSAGWDGTYNGEEVASGTYFYIITLSNGEELKGPVTLIRNK